jgi:hypothetical protein
MPSLLRSGKDNERYRAFARALLAENDQSKLLRHLGEIEAPRPYAIRIKPLFTKAGLRHAITSTASAVIRPIPGSDQAFGITTTKQGHYQDWAAFTLLPTGIPQVEAVVAISPRLGWLKILRLLRDAYPAVVPIYLSQAELLGTINDLRIKLHGEYDLRVRELSAKEPGADGHRGAQRSVREWTDEEWDQTLSLIAERKQRLAAVTLDFLREVNEATAPTPSVRCRLSKASEVETSGRFDLIWRSVIGHVSAIGAAKLSTYSKRGLRENGFQPAPLTIRFGDDVFSRVQEVRRLVATLSSYPHSLHAVQHGNPYAFVQVSDSIDGSAFDVWALSPRRITIVPRLVATEAAINRLIDYIFDRFKEGKVETHAEE